MKAIIEYVIDISLQAGCVCLNQGMLVYMTLCEHCTDCYAEMHCIEGTHIMMVQVNNCSKDVDVIV